MGLYEYFKFNFNSSVFLNFLDFILVSLQIMEPLVLSPGGPYIKL